VLNVFKIITILRSVDVTQPVSEKFKTVGRLPLTAELLLYERDSCPSYSLVEALQKQDLFINSWIAIGSEIKLVVVFLLLIKKT